jgi:hypothetical protein
VREGRERPYEPRREERHADEEQEHAHGHVEQPQPGAERARGGEHRVAEEHDRGGDKDERDVRRERCQPSARQLRALADSRDRRHLRRAEGRRERRKQRHHDADEQAPKDDRRRQADRRRRNLATALAEQPLDDARDQQAEEEPDDRRECADDQPLDHDRTEYLPPGRADRPERRELAHALRDRDRERVEDDERADEERDAREGEQEVADELRERRDVVRLLLRLLVARAYLRIRRQDGPDLRDELLGRRPGLGRRGDAVEGVLAVKQLLRGRDGEHGEGRAADGVDVAVACDADQRELAHGVQRRDADLVTDLEMLVVGGVDVDDHLV